MDEFADLEAELASHSIVPDIQTDETYEVLSFDEGKHAWVLNKRRSSILGSVFLGIVFLHVALPIYWLTSSLLATFIICLLLQLLNIKLTIWSLSQNKLLLDIEENILYEVEGFSSNFTVLSALKIGRDLNITYYTYEKGSGDSTYLACVICIESLSQRLEFDAGKSISPKGLCLNVKNTIERLMIQRSSLS